MMEVIVLMGQYCRSALINNGRLIFYEETENGDTFFFSLYQKLRQLAIDQVTVVTRSFLSTQQYEDGQAVYTVPIGGKEYYANLRMEELREITKFAGYFGLTPRIYDKLGYNISLLDGPALLIDEIQNAYHVLIQGKKGFVTSQYLSRDALGKIIRENPIILDTTAVYKESWLYPYQDLDLLESHENEIKMLLSLLTFTKSKEGEDYEVVLNETEILPIRQKSKPDKERPVIQDKRVRLLRWGLTLGILIMTILTGVSFSANQLLNKDIVALQSNKVRLLMELEQEKKELKQKEQFSSQLSTHHMGDMTSQLYQMEIKGYLGKIIFEEGRGTVLLYLKNVKQAPKVKHKIDKMAKVVSVRELPAVKAGGETLKKYQYQFKIEGIGEPGG